MMLQLVDKDTFVIHAHDGIRLESYFTACERGGTDHPRPAYFATTHNHITCLWCAAGRRRNDYKGP